MVFVKTPLVSRVDEAALELCERPGAINDDGGGSGASGVDGGEH